MIGHGATPIASVEQVLAVHGERLSALVGRRLLSAVGTCHVDDGDWCTTGVLILDCDGVQLAIGVDGFDLLYLSWDSIDPLVPIGGGDPDDPAVELVWGDPRQEALGGVLGGMISQVRVLEHEFRFDRVDGRRFEGWLLAGLELVFDDGRALQLWNEYGGLRITADPPDSGGWRRRTASRARIREIDPVDQPNESPIVAILPVSGGNADLPGLRSGDEPPVLCADLEQSVLFRRDPL